MKRYFKNLWNVITMLFWLFVLMFSITFRGLFSAIFDHKLDDWWFWVTNIFIKMGKRYDEILTEFFAKAEPQAEENIDIPEPQLKDDCQLYYDPITGSHFHASPTELKEAFDKLGVVINNEKNVSPTELTEETLDKLGVVTNNEENE